MRFKIVILLLILLNSCGVESSVESNNKDNNRNSSKKKIDDSKCLDLLSNAQYHEDEESYQNCVNSYSRLLGMGCGEKYADQIFQWMASAYIELDKLDSAKWAIDKGLKMLPDNRGVLGVASVIANKNNDTDNQLFYLKKKYDLENEIQEIINLTEPDDSMDDIMQLELKLGIENPKGEWGEELKEEISFFNGGRAKTFSSLSSYYKNKAKETGEDFYYDDQIDFLEEWAEIDLENSDDITKALRVAYKNAGRDAIDIDEKRWEQDQSNVNTALIYINELMNISEFEKAVEVSLLVLDENNDNIKILERLASAYLELYDQSEAINIYEKLIRLNPSEIKYQTKISEIYNETGEYAKAISFANKIVKIKPSAEAFYNRALIFISLVEYCKDDQLTMSDKAVYEMAWEDLKKAASKGHKKAKKQSRFYEKNGLITQFEDWFKLSGKPTTFKPKGKCYNMIKKSIRKRSF